MTNDKQESAGKNVGSTDGLGIKIGDICRTTSGAPARYLGNGRAMYISAMCNEVCVGSARLATGGEDRFPLPDDDDMIKYA